MSARSFARRLRRLGPLGTLRAGEAAVALSGARVALAVVPFRRLAKLLGDAPSPTAASAPRRATQVGSAIRVADAYLPWHSSCLVQALAAAGMLALRRQPAVTWLGVDRIDGELLAHAWVRSGEVLVVGGQRSRRFSPVAGFTPRRPDGATTISGEAVRGESPPADVPQPHGASQQPAGHGPKRGDS